MNSKRMKLRGFVVARHPSLGILILEANKVKKGKHFQLPGGHAEPEDFQISESKNNHDIAKIAAARELFEETGIDVRNHLSRLIPLNIDETEKSSRYYFELLLNDDDQIDTSKHTSAVWSVDSTINDFHNKADYSILSPRSNIKYYSISVDPALNLKNNKFCLGLSNEHTGFRFENSIDNAALLVSQHSNGYSTSALLRYAALIQQ